MGIGSYFIPRAGEGNSFRQLEFEMDGTETIGILWTRWAEKTAQHSITSVEGNANHLLHWQNHILTAAALGDTHNSGPLGSGYTIG